MTEDRRRRGAPAGQRWSGGKVGRVPSVLVIPRRYWAQASGNILVLLVLAALLLLRRDRRAAVQASLGALGLVTGTYVAWLARQTALLADRLAEEEERRLTFISVVAHELNNRMTPLLGYSQLLASQQESLPEGQRRAVQAIEAESLRLRRLVADLLDASRLESGRLTVEPEPMDLVEVARSVVQAEQVGLPDHRLRFVAPERLEGCWDRDRIAQVLSNLISNAAKYSSAGTEIQVSVRQVDDEAEFSVTDQGIGLTADEIAMLFEPYSRLYRERRAKGLGLGLFIARGIVQAHGGAIWATSPGPGRGSTFTVRLPIAAAAP